MSGDSAPLAGVALAVSAYRSDDAVIRLLRKAFDPVAPHFAAVIVVDSCGTGEISRAVEREGWAVRYINADHNLGSAGNLDLRLRTAADLGLDWCLALNHDGEIDAGKAARLVEHGRSRPHVGAVYPQLVFSAAGGRLDSPRRTFSTYGVMAPASETAAESPCMEVAWSSSNGALYRLEPVRDGLSTWPQLWMGYEDLAIGWELQRRGWVQLLCRDVQVSDNYEFSPVRVLGREVHLAAKPSWYMYYHLRNLLLVARESRGEAVSRMSILVRAAVDIGLILAFRDRKRERLKLMFRGIRDGLGGIAGKGPVP